MYMSREEVYHILCRHAAHIDLLHNLNTPRRRVYFTPGMTLFRIMGVESAGDGGDASPQ